MSLVLLREGNLKWLYQSDSNLGLSLIEDCVREITEEMNRRRLQEHWKIEVNNCIRGVFTADLVWAIDGKGILILWKRLHFHLGVRKDVISNRYALSPTELEVVQGLVRNREIREMSREFLVTPEAVKARLKGCYQKMEVQSQFQLLYKVLGYVYPVIENP